MGEPGEGMEVSGDGVKALGEGMEVSGEEMEMSGEGPGALGQGPGAHREGRQRRLLTSTGSGHLRSSPAVLAADSRDFSAAAAGEALLLKLQLLQCPLLTCSSSVVPGCAVILMFLFVTHPNNVWSKHTAKENTAHSCQFGVLMWCLSKLNAVEKTLNGH